MFSSMFQNTSKMPEIAFFYTLHLVYFLRRFKRFLEIKKKNEGVFSFSSDITTQNTRDWILLRLNHGYPFVWSQCATQMILSSMFDVAMARTVLHVYSTVPYRLAVFLCTVWYVIMAHMFAPSLYHALSLFCSVQVES